MASTHTFLLDALERVADGGDITAEELDAAIPDPSLLKPREKAAWQELSHWADDADIRSKDSESAKLKRQWMRDHMSTLQEDDWVSHPPTFRQRVLAGIWLAAFATTGTSYQFGWRLFGDYDRHVGFGVLVIGLGMIGPILVMVRRP